MSKVGEDVEMIGLSGEVTFNVISKILFGTDFKAEDVMVELEMFDGTNQKLDYYKAMRKHIGMGETTYMTFWIVFLGQKGISWNVGRLV